MLEERLSQTYGNHNLGYNASSIRPASNMYPSLAPSYNQPPGQAENFYTGAAIPTVPDYIAPQQHSHDQYQQPLVNSNEYQNSQYVQPLDYTQTRTQLPLGYVPQGTISMQSYPPVDSQQPNPSHNFPAEQKPTLQYSQALPPQTQPSISQGYQHAPLSPVSDVASTYQDLSRQQSFQPPVSIIEQSLPQTQQQPASPIIYHQQQQQQQPLQPQQQLLPSQVTVVQHQQQQQTPQQQQQQPYPQEQNYTLPNQQQPQTSWQPQQAATNYVLAPQIPVFGQQPVSRNAFPQAPTHQPQQLKVEEPLIEL